MSSPYFILGWELMDGNGRLLHLLRGRILQSWYCRDIRIIFRVLRLRQRGIMLPVEVLIVLYEYGIVKLDRVLNFWLQRGGIPPKHSPSHRRVWSVRFVNKSDFKHYHRNPEGTSIPRPNLRNRNKEIAESNKRRRERQHTPNPPTASPVTPSPRTPTY